MKKLLVSLFMLICLTAHSQDAEPPPDESVLPMPGENEQAAPEEPEKKPKVESPWKYGVGLSLSLRSKFISLNTSRTGVTGELNSELDFENSLSLELEARNVKKHDWGFQGGMTLDRERKLEGGKITATGVTVSVTSTSEPAKLQTNVFYGNAVYRWEDFYLPFGLNLSRVNYTPSPTANEIAEASGGWGFQAGAGYYFDEHLVVEGMVRSIGLKLKSTRDGATTDFGNSTLSTIMLTGKYLF